MRTIDPTNTPAFLETYPKPALGHRLYHGRDLKLWQGFVNIDRVQGWADNPRLELEMKRWKDQRTNAEITQEDLYDLMNTTKHVALDELSKNIRENGLREPIVLTFDGKLLDGNRRFFATKLACNDERDDSKRKELSIIPCFVLLGDSSDEDSHHILVEENFSPSLKREWPDHVKAKRIYEEHEAGKDNKDIAQKYGWNISKVVQTIRAYKISQDFISYATEDPDPNTERGGLGKSELDAESIASDNYQFFYEAQKSLRKPLLEEVNEEFAEIFYRRIAQKDFFVSFPEVRSAYEAYNDPQSRQILEKGEAGGGKILKALIQVKNSKIKELYTAQEKIDEFVKFLKEMSTEQKESISDESLTHLENALEVVRSMVKSRQ